MTPGEPQQPVADGQAAEAEPRDRRLQISYRWYHKISAVLFATFCLEVGFFLVIFPWTASAGDFAAFARDAWRPYWENLYVRGAISGLGVVDLYIAFVEINRLRRFARR